MDIMGWSDQRMLTSYQHVLDELRREAADSMGAALWSEEATTLAPGTTRVTK